jgi:hypothetical protein
MGYLKIITFQKLCQFLSLSLALINTFFRSQDKGKRIHRRIDKDMESCLDLVFGDDFGRVHEKDVIFCPESDHLAVMVKIKFNDKHKPYSKTIWSRNYTKF